MLIEANDLYKVFDKKEAVSGLTLSVREGEFLSILGPNGAGKTTTVNMLAGLSRPTSGTILYNGKPFTAEDLLLKAGIGVVPQHNNVDRDLTVEDNLRVHCRLFGLKSENEIIEKALNFSGLAAHKDKTADKLSGGMKRRLVISRSLLHEPKVLFLDEPTAGLDASVRRNIWGFIRSINKQHGCTVILTTHYIEEAEILADRVIIIDRGKIAAEGGISALKASVGTTALDVYANDNIETLHFASRQDALKKLEEITAEAKIRDVTLEDVYIRITGKRIDV